MNVSFCTGFVCTWRNKSWSCFVGPRGWFCNWSSNSIRPGGLSLAFKRAVTALGHGDLNFHALRHTYATTLLEQGEHPLVVSTNLGHSDIQVTLNTYSHVTPALQRRAAEAMDEVLGKELIESRELVAIP